MFRAAYRSSSGALIVIAAFGLHTHVVTGRSQVSIYVTLTISTNGENPGTFHEAMLFWQMDANWIEKHFHFILRS